jgi:PAS domain S-box-containing protein
MKLKNSIDATFQSFLESVPDAIVIVNDQGNIQSINRQTETLFGYERNEILGKKIEVLMPSRFRTEHLHHRKVYADNPKIRNMGKGMELFAQHKSGEEFPVEISLSTIDSEQELLVCATIRDITEQKRIQRELIDAKIKAENAAKSKQQFLANMSHEIRTPLNAIIGFTKVILKTDLTTKQIEYLTAIKTSGDTLVVLINDILDLAKVDAGKMVFETVPFRLSLSISSMLHLFEPKIQEKNLELIVEYDESIPEILVGDPIRLHQIILNLVSNAVKFTAEGKIKVKIRRLVEDEKSVTLEFSVSDSGIGINADKRDKIFENFQQAHDETSRIYGGTGLGLAIVKQLVEGQGGSIHLESELGKGSTFSVVLNFKKTTGTIVLENEMTELVDTDLKNSKVLVVEDVELNQLLMRTLLDDFGFECDIADHGKMAIEKLESNTYDIILMDLQMPIMNGFQATDYIRNTMKSSIPIIALTADVTATDIQKYRAVGMNDYVAKPIDDRKLYNKMVSILKTEREISQTKTVENENDHIGQYVDMTYLHQITKSDPKIMAEIIQVYLKQTPPIINTMRECLIDKDWKRLQAAVHKMIPSFAIMGLGEEVAIKAKKIQEQAHLLEKSSEINFLVEELAHHCTEACNQLEAELKKFEN